MLRSIFAGILALAALEAVVSSGAAADRFGGLVKGAAAVIRYVLDPTVPAIPDLSGE